MTSSAAEPDSLEVVRRRVYLALFVALAIAVHTFEALLPTPLPWFRLGLANILGLVALFSYGVAALWTLSLLRVVLGSLLLGGLFGPGFLLSFGGTLLACTLMSGAYRLWQGRVGPVSVSVLGALGHVCGQLLVAWLVVVRHPAIWRLLPFFLLFALISGIINGLAAHYLLGQLVRRPAFSDLLQRQSFSPAAGPNAESQTEANNQQTKEG